MEYLRIYLFLTVTVTSISGSKEASDDESPRRFSNPHEPSVILGVPQHPYHLPPAEPILPGHTLIRPAIGMLKSAVKFPHREQENGSGVYGHFENIGIKFDGKNERVLYTGFRRSQPNVPLQPYPLVENKAKRRHHHRFIPSNRLSGLNNPNDIVYRILQKYPKIASKMSSKKNSNFISIKYPGPEKNILRHREDDNGRYGETSLGKVNKNTQNMLIIAVETINAKDITDLLRIIQSVRRDDINNSVEDKPPAPPVESEELKYVPGKNSFGLAPANFDSEEGEVSNKTVLFWNTKNLFNHIKFNPEAPEHADMLPPDSSEKARNWWFYHQSDFEEFEDR